MTANPVVDVQRGALVGGGSWEKTESTANIANFYDWGAVSAMPYFECFPLIATREGDMETVKALKSIRARLARAARALDHMLAALSNQAQIRTVRLRSRVDHPAAGDSGGAVSVEIAV